MPDPLTYRLPRDCCLREAQALRREFMAVLEGAQAVEIDCGSVDRADISLVQLVVSAHRTASRNAKTLGLTNASPAVLSAFARAGLDGSEFLVLAA